MLPRSPIALHVRKMRVLCIVRKVFFCPTPPCIVTAVARGAGHGSYPSLERAFPNLQLHPGTPSAYPPPKVNNYEWAKPITTFLQMRVVS